MSNTASSLLDTSHLSALDIENIFSVAQEISDRFKQTGSFYKEKTRDGSKIICSAFFEPSTRTRMSFQMAAERLGLRMMAIESGSSSLVKGESFSDSILNLVAMKPDALIVRYGFSPELDHLLPKLNLPVINAGSGVKSHPTQALLDAYTIHLEKKSQKQNILILGDILHSRVARSNLDVLSKLGHQIAFFGPSEFLPKKSEFPKIEFFNSLPEALKWCSVCMGLRIQLERHESMPLSVQNYNEQFGLNKSNLKFLSKDAMILHPGPVNLGIEFTKDVVEDPRYFVLKQVENGVFIRAAILSMLLKL